jgi:hypothetical protein
MLRDHDSRSRQDAANENRHADCTNPHGRHRRSGGRTGSRGGRIRCNSRKMQSTLSTQGRNKPWCAWVLGRQTREGWRGNRGRGRLVGADHIDKIGWRMGRLYRFSATGGLFRLREMSGIAGSREWERRTSRPVADRNSGTGKYLLWLGASLEWPRDGGSAAVADSSVVSAQTRQLPCLVSVESHHVDSRGQTEPSDSPRRGIWTWIARRNCRQRRR